MNQPTSEPTSLPSLASILHRATLRVAFIAVSMVGASLFVLGLFILRFYLQDNLNLSARSVAYAVEAPVVFNDKEATREALETMIANRPIAAAYVVDRDGDEIARWQAPAGPMPSLGRLMAEVLLARDAIEPIRHNGRDVGIVKLEGSGHDLVVFVQFSLGCGLLAFLLCALVASRLSGNASERIVGPLQALARLTTRARHERHFRQRLEPAPIAELRSLGDDFNALLAELDSWQAQMLQHHENLTYQANHDRLTGLANRAYFENELGRTIDRMKHAGGYAALFFIDADRFKSINDELGHEVGDVVLRTIARRLRAMVRESDLVARLGGDEFAVLLSPLAERSQARRIAVSMLDSMVEAIELPGGGRLNTSISIGIAFYPDHALEAGGLLKKADEAMYQSKRAGRGAYSVALPGVAQVL